MNFTIQEIRKAVSAARWLSDDYGETPTALSVRNALVLQYVEYNSESRQFELTLKYFITKQDLN